MSIYLTDPESNSYQHTKGDFDFKIALETAWIDMGVPLYYARLATIDFKNMWIPCFKNKMSAERTAKFLFNDIVKSYRIKSKLKRKQR